MRYCMVSHRLIFSLLFLCSSLVVVAQDMFDYSRIGDHPRLFMRANDFVTLENQITKSPELKTIHDIILSKCDNLYLQSPTLQHQLDESGKRLLGVSRAA